MVSALVVLFLGAACTGGGSGVDTGPSTPAYHPTGRIVMLSGRFLTGLDVLDAATDRQSHLRLPARGGAYSSAWPAPDGRMYALPTLGLFSENSRGQLFLIGDRRPERVGPPIEDADDFQARGGYAVAWGCPAPMRLLDLAHPTEWREIGHTCSASMSPDGKRLAFTSPTGLSVMDLPDGTPHEVLRFRDLDELRPAHVPAQSLDNVSWGTPGIAVEVGDASRSAMVVWREDRPPVVVPLGVARPEQMEWQPGGRLLAFYDFAPYGEVLTLDPDTGTRRQIAVSDFGRLSWSPDGRVVAAPRSENVLALVDPRSGAQLGTLTTAGLPVIWLAR